MFDWVQSTPLIKFITLLKEILKCPECQISWKLKHISFLGPNFPGPRGLILVLMLTVCYLAIILISWWLLLVSQWLLLITACYLVVIGGYCSLLVVTTTYCSFSLLAWIQPSLWYSKQEKKTILSGNLCVCCIMSCSEIVSSQDGIFQCSTVSIQKLFCRQSWWQLLVNTTLTPKFRENNSTFNFLANTLLCWYFYDQICEWVKLYWVVYLELTSSNSCLDGFFKVFIASFWISPLVSGW